MAQNKNRDSEMIYVDRFGDSNRVIPKINTYANNNNLYVGLDGYDDEYSCWDPYCDVTVNVGKLPFLESAIDINNNGDKIIAFLEQNGFGQLTEKAIPSGYCWFPVFRFNAEKLKEIDAAGFAAYEKAHGRDTKTLEEQINAAEKGKEDQPSAARPSRVPPIK